MAYEIRMAGLSLAPAPDHQYARVLAPHEDLERLIAHFETAALSSGFLDPASPKRLMLRLRRLFFRAQVEQEEVSILRGLLSALEKSRHGQKTK
jgi:tRNA/rRNA methyltransferase